jgi:hypothetical protein
MLVLVSSTSFMVGMHLCMGKVQAVALFDKAEGCEKEQSLPPCHRHQKAPCCEDETIIHESEDFKTGVSEIQVMLPLPVEIEQAFTFVSEIIPSAPLSRIKYCNYDPPLRSCDLTVEHQVFLI